MKDFTFKRFLRSEIYMHMKYVNSFFTSVQKHVKKICKKLAYFLRNLQYSLANN